MWGWAIGLGVLLVALHAAPTVEGQSAEPSSQEDVERGRALFLEGRDAFEAGEFETAFEKFRLSYDLVHKPKLLFNLGAAADRLRREKQALSYFERYVREMPDAPNRAEVEGRMAQLRESIEARRTANARTLEELNRARDEAAHASADSRPTAAWVLTGVSAGVTAAGGVLFGLGLRDRRNVEEAREGIPWEEVAGAHARTPKLTGAGIALFAAGGTGLVAGLTWAFVHRRRTRNPDRRRRKSERTAPTVEIGMNGVFLRGEF